MAAATVDSPCTRLQLWNLLQQFRLPIHKMSDKAGEEEKLIQSYCHVLDRHYLSGNYMWHTRY